MTTAARVGVWLRWAAAVLLIAAWPSGARAQVNVPPKELDGVEVTEHLGSSLPLDAAFRDHEGRPTRLLDILDGRRPTLLVFAYHTCPMLCSMVLDGTVKALKETPWTVGREFDVLTVSIDPRDTPEAAARKRAQVAERYGRSDGGKGFHFLVGDEANIRRVTDAAGFGYRYDERQEQYAIFLLTPDGRLARYLYGFQFDPQDIRLGLLEASEGRSISTVERLLLYCYHYDPQGKRYALVAMRVMRVGGLVTMVALGSLLTVLWLRERRRSRRGADSLAPNPSIRPTTHAS